MGVAADGFDWDAGNRDKCQKHGLSIAEIEAFFLKNPKVAPDLRHSSSEHRMMAVGRNTQGRAMFVVFTVRIKDGLHLIRPLTARYMHRNEIEGYETENS
jgi:uncharacterized DUF497 family protein